MKNGFEFLSVRLVFSSLTFANFCLALSVIKRVPNFCSHQCRCFQMVNTEKSYQFWKEMRSISTIQLNNDCIKWQWYLGVDPILPYLQIFIHSFHSSTKHVNTWIHRKQIKIINQINHWYCQHLTVNYNLSKPLNCLFKIIKVIRQKKKITHYQRKNGCFTIHTRAYAHTHTVQPMKRVYLYLIQIANELNMRIGGETFCASRRTDCNQYRSERKK